MARCDKCIHCDVCFTVLDAAECKNFKDHSRFVDIAEVKRKIIRPLCNRCAALTDCQTCPACALEIREHCEHYKEAEQALSKRTQKKENEFYRGHCVSDDGKFCKHIKAAKGDNLSNNNTMSCEYGEVNCPYAKPLEEVNAK